MARNRLSRPASAVLPLAACLAALCLGAALQAQGAEASAPPTRAAFAPDRESASFGLCSGRARYTCVVDGDTLWYRGEKIRLLDINTPEVSQPGCAFEAELGRKLRRVTRNGESLGEVLVEEGLAERWKGYRGSWC